MDYCFAPLEMKFASTEADAGTFSGYGAVFGNVDSYGDMIAPGAFKTSLAEFAARGWKVSMYVQHAFGDPRPIGVWDEVVEDAKGLAVKGRLLGLDTETGRYHYALAKGGALSGLSIGFRPVKADYPNEAGKPRRVIKEAKVFEVSLVDQPANPLAQVGQIKSVIGEIQTFAELEKFLRNEYRMSRSEAMAVLAAVKRVRLSDSANDLDEGLRDASDIAAIAALARRNATIIKR